jgi:hypothetical protein
MVVGRVNRGVGPARRLRATATGSRIEVSQAETLASRAQATAARPIPSMLTFFMTTSVKFGAAYIAALETHTGIRPARAHGMLRLLYFT